jgi:hypothetical protein
VDHATQYIHCTNQVSLCIGETLKGKSAFPWISKAIVPTKHHFALQSLSKIVLTNIKGSIIQALVLTIKMATPKVLLKLYAHVWEYPVLGALGRLTLTKCLVTLQFKEL